MLLEDRIAVVYGAGGFVGGAVTRAFAREGAHVFLAGRTPAKLEKVAADIASAGGTAEIEQVDVLDEAAVDDFTDAVAARAGRIDISFNAVTFGDVQGAPLADMALEHVTQPVSNALRAQFLTVRAAAHHMIKRGSGVVMTVTGYLQQPYPAMGGTPVAWSTVESLYRQWACELGPRGVRVTWLRTAGFRESILGAAAYESVYMLTDGVPVPLSDLVDDTSAEQNLEAVKDQTMLKRLPSLAEAGSTAAFLASDHAKSITASAVNLTSGAVAD